MMPRRDHGAPESKGPSHLSRPLPQQFGLSPELDADAYMDEVKKKERLRDCVVFVLIYVVGLVALNSIIYLLKGDNDPQLWVFIIPAVFAFVYKDDVAEQFKRLVGDPVDPAVRSYVDAIRAYDVAVRDWNDRQLETGRTYWREKRGVAFEAAVQALLVRRGASVDTTKGSGDGGIDLIVRLNGATFWCQCKGHASPIGVAVVREIAGVCSRGGGAPVVIAVNGYTSAAVATANELGVLLIDTPQLLNLATRNRIVEWQ